MTQHYDNVKWRKKQSWVTTLINAGLANIERRRWGRAVKQTPVDNLKWVVKMKIEWGSREELSGWIRLDHPSSVCDEVDYGVETLGIRVVVIMVKTWDEHGFRCHSSVDVVIYYNECVDNKHQHEHQTMMIKKRISKNRRAIHWVMRSKIG